MLAKKALDQNQNYLGEHVRDAIVSVYQIRMLIAKHPQSRFDHSPRQDLDLPKFLHQPSDCPLTAHLLSLSTVRSSEN